MKLPLLTSLSGITLISYLLGTTNVIANAKIPSNPNHQTSEKELAVKQEALSKLSTLSRAQQAYFIENNRFATQIKQLGLGDATENSIQDYQLQFFADNKLKQVAMTVLSPNKTGSRTYVSFIYTAVQDSGNTITSSKLCESQHFSRVIPKLRTKIPKKGDFNCPSGFKVLELTQKEQDILKQPENESNLKLVVSSINSLQEINYDKNQVFTDNLQSLFDFDISKFNAEFRLQALPIQNIKNGVITLATFPGKSYKSYVGIVLSTKNTTGKIQSAICEVPQNTSIDLEKLAISLTNNLINCPSNSRAINLNEEEMTSVNQIVEEAQKNLAITAEIAQPKNNSLLVAADNLAKSGKYLEALRKYYQALDSLEISESDFFALAENNNINPRRDAFFNKIKPVLEAAQPLIKQQQKEIEQEMSSLIARFPKEKNDTARKIQKITTSQLGFNILNNLQQDLSVASDKNKEYLEFSQFLQDYFDEKSNKLNGKLPETARRYLNKNGRAITTIRDLALNGEIPHWGVDYKWIIEGDLTAPIPQYISIVNLQRLLALDMLKKHQEGNNQEALKSLEASWKISALLTDDPSFIGQAVNMIVSREQLRIIGELGALPVVWQQRLIARDYTKSMFVGLNSEAFFHFQSLNKILPPGKDTISNKLYLNWYTINTYLWDREFYKTIEQRKNNLCSLDIDALTQQYLNSNVAIKPNFTNYVLKSQYLMLKAEMMTHTLQIKGQISQGKGLPNKLENIPSNICQDRQWVYKSLPSGKWSISLDKQPVWLSKINLSPLTHTTQR